MSDREELRRLAKEENRVMQELRGTLRKQDKVTAERVIREMRKWKVLRNAQIEIRKGW